MTKAYMKRPAAQARAYSQAVVSEGGRVVWLAGQVAAEDASGKSLAGDFDGQVREVFSRLGNTLAEGRRRAQRYGDDDRVHHRRAARRPLYTAAQGDL
jgi:enamine deaminase RidA (YjgF/YER057c/UK114 family)